MTATAIMIGYPYRVILEFIPPAGETVIFFPSGGTWRADLKPTSLDPAATATAVVTRVADDQCEFTLSATEAAKLTPGIWYADIVRTDTTPDEHTFISIEVRVEWPISRQGDMA